MNFAEPHGYSQISASQLEEMLSKATAPEERRAILLELDRRLSREQAAGPAYRLRQPPQPGDRGGQAGFRAPPPPPLQAPPSQAGWQPSYPPPHAPGSNPRQPRAAPPFAGTNRMAIAALALAIVWLYGLGSIAALATAWLALRQIKARNQAGRRLAIAAIVIAVFGLLALAGTG